jgi:hypothetical protein
MSNDPTTPESDRPEARSEEELQLLRDDPAGRAEWFASTRGHRHGVLTADELLHHSKALLRQNLPLEDLARAFVVEHPNIDITELAVAVNHVMLEREAAEAAGDAPQAMAFDQPEAGQDDVADATQLAAVLVAAAPSATPDQIAVALKDPRVYPTLTAVQMGTVLKAATVFPAITAEQMSGALLAAGYSQADTDSAVKQLFPPAVTYRTVSPVGNPQGTMFDDAPAAKEQASPITQVNIHAGDIIDQIQAVYGGTAFPVHGGTRGGPASFTLDAGDVLTEVSGYYGMWFGRVYILQLSFRTRNGKTSEPYGAMTYAASRTPFTLTAEAGEQLWAFSGSFIQGLEADNTYSYFVTSIGATFRKG